MTMITKNYKSIFSFVAALTLGIFMVGCEQEDDTGYSTLIPNSTDLGITTEITNVTLVEDNSVYEFTASISEVQLVDVKLYAFQVSGDATLGDDFTLDQSLVIPAGSTSVTGEIKIIQDDIYEETETAKIQIGNNKTANATEATATMNFTILNYSEGDLVLDLSWAMASAATDDSGTEIDPEDFADMRLVISSTPDNTGDIDVADGAGFETIVLPSDLPDGDYYIVSDFYAANADIVRDLNLSLNLYQNGIINDDHYDFANAISNLGTCDLNFYVMAKIVKSGTTYTYENVSTQSYELSVYTPWEGGFDSVDAWSPAEGYASHLETKEICDGFFILGINAEWMLNSWGEEIQPDSEAEVFAVLNADGTFTIASQPIFTTKYDGSLYPYTVSGSGTYDLTTGVLHLEYYLDQEGFDVSGWMFDNGYMDTNYFLADVTLAM